jgi:hypothetical protein
MAKTWERFDPAARQAQAFVNTLREARRLGRELAEYHLQNGFSDAGDDPTPAYVRVETDGDIKGHAFTPTSYMNTVVLAQEVEKLLTNQVPAPNNYVYTIEQVVKL